MVDFRPLKIVLVVGICAIILHGEFSRIDHVSVFSDTLTGISGLALACVALFSFLWDRRDASYLPARWPFISSAIAAIAACCWLGLNAWLALRDPEVVVLRAAQFQDFNGTSLYLMENGRYRYCDVVFSETCCAGTWTGLGDTLVLLSHDGCEQGSLVIQPCRTDSTKRCLCWTGEMAASPEMWLHEDHRSK